MKQTKPPAFKAIMRGPTVTTVEITAGDIATGLADSFSMVRGPTVTMEITADDIATGLADSFSMVTSAVKRQAALAAMYETHVRMSEREAARAAAKLTGAKDA